MHIDGPRFPRKDVYIPASTIEDSLPRVARTIEELFWDGTDDQPTLHLVQYWAAGDDCGNLSHDLAGIIPTIDMTQSTLRDTPGTTPTIGGHLVGGTVKAQDAVILVTATSLTREAAEAVKTTLRGVAGINRVLILSIVNQLNTADLHAFTSDDRHKFTYQNGHIYAEPPEVMAPA